MKKIFLFLSVIMLLFCSTNAMAFTDVGHKDTNKIEISKATPVLDQMEIVNLEAFMVNTAFDVGWQQNLFIIKNIAVMPVQLKLQPNYQEIYDSQFLDNDANNYKLKRTVKIQFYQSYPYMQPTPFLYT